MQYHIEIKDIFNFVKGYFFLQGLAIIHHLDIDLEL